MCSFAKYDSAPPPNRPFSSSWVNVLGYLHPHSCLPTGHKLPRGSWQGEDKASIMPACLCDSYTARVGNLTWSPQGTAKLSRGTETQRTDRHKLPATHRGTEIINRKALDTRKNTPQLQKHKHTPPSYINTRPAPTPSLSVCISFCVCMSLSACLSPCFCFSISLVSLSVYLSVCLSLSLSLSHACARAHTHTHTHTLPKYTMETEPEDPPNTTRNPPCLPTSLSSSFF